jgi:hypothetical protein
MSVWKLTLAAIAVTMPAVAANATDFVFNHNVFGTPAGYTLYDNFDDEGGQNLVTGANYGFPTGDHPGSSLTVPGNLTPYLAVYGGGVANINFTGVGDVRSFSFDYSTVDTYNTLTIHYATGADTVYTGTQILNGLPTAVTNGSITVNGDGRIITGLSLSTTSNAFEVDNLSFSAGLAAVPEPASWALMLGGFGVIGGAMRSRRKPAHGIA